MVVEKSQESAILDAIAGSRPGFLLTPAGIQHLQLNGVSDELIRVMAAAENGRPRNQTAAALDASADRLASRKPSKVIQAPQLVRPVSPVAESDTLRVTSTPPGATVEWNRKVIGVTPLVYKVGEYAFNARKSTIFSKRLFQPVTLRITLPGFMTKDVLISREMVLTSLNGRRTPFHVIPFQDFDFKLDKISDKPKVLTNADIVQLWKVGFGDALIIDKIAASATAFDLELPAMVKLKEEGIPDGVIQAMMRKSVTP